MEDQDNQAILEPSITKLLLTAKEASQALAVSEKTLWTYTRKYNIPVVKIGSAIRYDPEDLKRFIQSRKETG